MSVDWKSVLNAFCSSAAIALAAYGASSSQGASDKQAAIGAAVTFLGALGNHLRTAPSLVKDANPLP